jgi:hypothetical protein
MKPLATSIWATKKYDAAMGDFITPERRSLPPV